MAGAGNQLGPITQGDLLPVWTITLKLTDNSAHNLTGATFTGTLWDEETSNRITLGGTFSITDAANGKFTYAPVAADVADAGRYTVEFAITQSAKPFYVSTPLLIRPRKKA